MLLSLMTVSAALAAEWVPPLKAGATPPVASVTVPTWEAGTQLGFPVLGSHLTFVRPQGGWGYDVGAEMGLAYVGPAGGLWLRTGADHHEGFHAGVRGFGRTGFGIDGALTTVGSWMPVDEGQQSVGSPWYVGFGTQVLASLGWGRHGALTCALGGEYVALMGGAGFPMAEVDLRADVGLGERSALFVHAGFPSLVGAGFSVSR